MIPAFPHLKAALVLVGLLSCDPQPPAAVNFRYSEKEPVFFNDMSTERLRVLAPSMTTVNLADFPITSGVTQGKITMETSILFKAQETLAGRYCLWPAELDVTAAYRAQVYIAHEYKPGSCRYLTTKLHELRHVAADKEVLKEYLPALRKKAEAKAAQQYPAGPFDVTQREAMRSLILASFQDALTAELDKLERVRALRQQVIDTPTEYMRLSKACPGEPIR